MGIVGFGRVGRALAERLAGFGVNLAFDPHVGVENAVPCPAKNGTQRPHELGRHRDLALLETGSRRASAGRGTTGAYAARRLCGQRGPGGLVDENALYGLLVAGHLRARRWMCSPRSLTTAPCRAWTTWCSRPMWARTRASLESSWKSILYKTCLKYLGADMGLGLLAFDFDGIVLESLDPKLEAMT